MTAEPARCSVAARARGDAVLATAPPARGFLVLEVPGPWGSDRVPATGLPAPLERRLHAAAAACGVRVLAVRRPGRHPSRDGARWWGVVAVGGRARWGRWNSPDDVADLDVAAHFAASVAGDSGSGDSGGGLGGARPVVLVCTQGRHDLCCAMEGRPVADVLAADDRLDVWECSHLGGDRFAANLLWLPSGYLFGSVTAAAAARLVDTAVSGGVVLDHFRGRCGDEPPAQAAQWLLMRHLAEWRPDRVQVHSPPATPGPGEPFAVRARHAGRAYRVILVWDWSPPRQLTCRAERDARVRVYRLAEGSGSAISGDDGPG